MWQRYLIEFAHIKPTAASFAFPKMLGFAQCRSARLLSHDRAARDRWRYARDRSFLGIARFDRDFDFVVMGSLDSEQDAPVGFVSDQPKKLSRLVVLLGEGQSAVSDRARAAHGYASRRASWRSGPAWHEVLQRIRNVVTVDVASALDFEGDIF